MGVYTIRSKVTEHWRPVVGYEGLYEVSSIGRVRNVVREKILTPSDSNGYCTIGLRRDGKHKTKLVHRIVLEAFVGPCPDNMICRHLNCRRKDNRSKNLRWGTHKENGEDMRRHYRSVHVNKPCDGWNLFGKMGY